LTFEAEREWVRRARLVLSNAEGAVWEAGL